MHKRFLLVKGRRVATGARDAVPARVSALVSDFGRSALLARAALAERDGARDAQLSPVQNALGRAARTLARAAAPAFRFRGGARLIRRSAFASSDTRPLLSPPLARLGRAQRLRRRAHGLARPRRGCGTRVVAPECRARRAACPTLRGVRVADDSQR